MKTAQQLLEQFWGFTSFKPLQEEIINAVLDGNDTVALLPTGGGKSVCFQIPSLVQEGICIVVSPLVALMNDQTQNLKAKGIKALSISGGLSFDELRTLLDNAIYGNYKFLYLSPERLQQDMVQGAIRQMNVNSIAVDEAHCISQWGNDFRPAYKNITVLRELKPLAPIIALTATATPEVLKDTIKELQLNVPKVFQNSFIRENLSYKVQFAEDKLYHIQKLLKDNTGSAIVYVRSRKLAVETSDQLNSLGIRAAFYHGGVSPKEKKERAAAWREGRVSTMVATNAFGMGIDHPNVRFVIHIQLPESLEGYFQEAGRAGRDGELATAVILYNTYDKTLVERQFIAALATPDGLKKLYRNLNNYFQISYGEGVFTEHAFNFTEFCSRYALNTLLTYNALNTLDRLGIIQLSQEFGRRSIVQFISSSETVLDYFSSHPIASVIGKSLLRLYGGIFETPTSVNLDVISKKTGQHTDTIITTLQQLERAELITLQLKITDASITFLVPREDDKTINVVSKQVVTQYNNKVNQVRSVLRYIENTRVCRSHQMVRYFGEKPSIPCGVCSVCLNEESVSEKNKNTNEIKSVSELILELLKQKPMSSRELSEKTTFALPDLLQTLQLLLENRTIALNSKNEYYIAK
ncbi:RecQ family ATP-dependent DNA helicase [Cochleicola gelatinilyticus]|uniref:ATP-dependent DNA helicase RecQ n=1 Tax=Cochleicola gelatinilyticus TaxID=1763537 RepID=A0A167HS83_9FLAO|nr:ATP-dependent DNA helicase RecQ [Cochleicola gelatinilyticus]OAB78911.1 recombinase RecQ [Cochleicola gelatinilyticus]